MLKSVFACKPALAVAAILAVGSLLSATDASAGYGHRGGYHHGGFHGGGYRAYPAYRWGHHRPYAHRSFYRHGFRAYPRYYYPRYYYPRYSYYGYGCYRWRWVPTPWGWRLRHVNVCYPRYRSRYWYY